MGGKEVKIEIDLHEKSEAYIKETFLRYTKTDDSPFLKTIKHCIIHMYPCSDTYQDDGELNGYSDALNFRVSIYDIENMTVYNSSFHDAIFTEVQCQVKYFKDLSTMMHFERPIQLIMGKGIHVIKPN